MISKPNKTQQATKLRTSIILQTIATYFDNLTGKGAISLIKCRTIKGIIYVSHKGLEEY